MTFTLRHTPAPGRQALEQVGQGIDLPAAPPALPVPPADPAATPPADAADGNDGRQVEEHTCVGKA